MRLPIERRTVDVYREYQLRLLRAGAMDFDDLLVNTVELFKRHDDVLAHYRQRFKHVLVDEYQDTNHVQNEMVVLLTTGHRRVFVVGDSDQSIYQFRGANIRNILEFEQAFPEASVVLLEQNYRSTQTILDAANSVIAHNMSRKPKELWTDQGDGEKIVRYHSTRSPRLSGSPTKSIVSQRRRLPMVISRSSTAPTPRAALSRITSTRRINYK